MSDKKQHYNKSLGSHHWQEMTKDDILRAIANSTSNASAARYLGVCKATYKKHAMMYSDDEGNNLYVSHNNKYGLGIRKKKIENQKTSQILDIISGKISPTAYDPQKLKRKIISEGYLHEKCSRCGYDEQRVSDMKVPLLLVFRDGNKKNWDLDNLILFCFNCYHNYIGDVFTQKQLAYIEGITNPKNVKLQETLELSTVHMKALEDILTNKLQRDPGKIEITPDDLLDHY